MHMEPNMIDDAKPLFTQIAEKIEDSILNGTLPELSKAPSTNELAGFYSINPATAAKGINELVSKGVLEKRRGVGMRSEEHTSELQSRGHLVCRLLLETNKISNFLMAGWFTERSEASHAS